MQVFQYSCRKGKIRTFFLLMTVVLIGICRFSEYRDASAAQEAPPTVYRESPQLHRMVEAGKLPVVDRRLPLSPALVQPFERIGTYGGTWTRAIRRNRDHASFIRVIGYENLMRWDPLWINAIPNIAKRYEVNEDATRYTFYMREGMRWSDGHPFTADDILFWYEDVLSNKELTPSVPAWLTSGGKPVEVEKLDDFAVVFSFEVPNGLFPMNLAAPWGAEPTEYPLHYLRKFHPRHNPDGIDKLVSDAKLGGWAELFRKRAGTEIDHPSRWQNPELPRLHAWTLKTVYSPEADEVVAERNPYYWKVDPAGNQLPYIDRVRYMMFDEKSQLDEMVKNGELDMQTRHISQKTLKELGRERTFSLVSSFSNTAVVSLNLTHPDPAMRKLFQDKNFRIGLSCAIDRKKIVSEVFDGEGEPYQAAPKPESPFYHERLARQYVEYNPILAFEHLDKAGCVKRDAEGFRLGPGGEPISLTLDVIDFLSMLEVARFIPEYWNAAGIRTRLNVMEREAFYERKTANLHDAAVWVGDGGLEVLLEPRWYFPSSSIESNYAIPWARWYRDRDDPLGEPPPEIVRKQMGLYDQILATADRKKQFSLMSEILKIGAEQFYAIGISTPPLRYGILNPGFHNVPTFITHSWTYPHPAPTNPCQYFMDGE